MYDFTILKNICFVGLKYQKYRCIKIYEVLFNKKTRTAGAGTMYNKCSMFFVCKNMNDAMLPYSIYLQL